MTDTLCEGTIVTNSNLLKPWNDGCITSFTLTQSAIDANSGNKSNDAILGAVFNAPPGLPCGAADVKSRMAMYFPPNVVKEWTLAAIPFVSYGENGAPDNRTVFLACRASFGGPDPITNRTPGCGAVWTLEGWIPTAATTTNQAE
ncbi:hypothetical protein HDU98_005875, partial [Podochytrium sp. JEL0797]